MVTILKIFVLINICLILYFLPYIILYCYSKKQGLTVNNFMNKYNRLGDITDWQLTIKRIVVGGIACNLLLLIFSLMETPFNQTLSVLIWCGLGYIIISIIFEPWDLINTVKSVNKSLKKQAIKL